MKTSNNHSSVSIGKTTSSFEELQMLCREEAEKLSKKIEIKKNETISIPFWTADFPELICVGKFSLNENDSIVYELDFSKTTL